jgi:hypothetical protein
MWHVGLSARVTVIGVGFDRGILLSSGGSRVSNPATSESGGANLRNLSILVWYVNPTNLVGYDIFINYNNY